MGALIQIAIQFALSLIAEYGVESWGEFVAMTADERYKWLMKYGPYFEVFTTAGLSASMGALPATRRLRDALRRRVYRGIADGLDNPRVVAEVERAVQAGAEGATKKSKRKQITRRKNGHVATLRDCDIGHASSTLRERFKSSHWGIEAQSAYQIDDDDLPDELCIMGTFVAAMVEAPGDEDVELELQCKDKQCFVTFALSDDERVYLVLSDSYRRWCKRELWQPGHVSYSLSSVAKKAPGRQNNYGGWASVKVQPIGVFTDIVYKTHKKGDGVSEYIHEFGEETGQQPILCVDETGRLWLAGGNYSTPDAGITD